MGQANEERFEARTFCINLKEHLAGRLFHNLFTQRSVLPFVLLWLTIWDYVARTSLLTLFLLLSPSILIAKAFIQIILFYFTLFRSNNKIYARLGKSKATSRKQEWEKEGSKEKEKQQEDEQKQQLEGGTKRFTYTFCYDNVNFRQQNK